jgi:DNA-binding transcriptional LysR family regulator
MDLVAACRVFVHVGERGSFTVGAAAARVAQSVASRRVAALERHLGAPLFDRSTRRAALTEFGRDMLRPAKRLVQLADALADSAEQARLRPLTVAVPATCAVRDLAVLDGAAAERGRVLQFRPADPAERAELLRSGEVRVALLAAPSGDAAWVVPLGLAGAARGGSGPVRLDTLRPRRGRRSYRRVWIQPEDDVPHVRDRVEGAAHRAGLLPAQISVAGSLTAAVSDVLRTDNLLLCAAAQARELGLPWRRIAGDGPARGFVVAGATPADAACLHPDLARQVARCLGIDTGAEAR